MTATDTGFKSTVESLKAKVDNLHPKDRDRAKGIIENVEKYGYPSPRQAKEITRLEGLAKKKWRNTYKPRPSWDAVEARPGETPIDLYRRSLRLIESTRFFNDGHRSAKEQILSARAAVKARYEKAVLGEEGYAAEQKRLYFVRQQRQVNFERNRTKREIRFIVEHYDRARWLHYALPEIDLPHLKHRRDLIACLSRRLQYLRRGGPKTSGTFSDWEIMILRVRACLIAEGRAELISRRQARMPIEAEEMSQ